MSASQRSLLSSVHAIAPNDLVLGERLGAGATGEVYHAQLGGSAVAAKLMIELAGKDPSKEAVRASLRELQVYFSPFTPSTLVRAQTASCAPQSTAIAALLLAPRRTRSQC